MRMEKDAVGREIDFLSRCGMNKRSRKNGCRDTCLNDRDQSIINQTEVDVA